MAKCRIINTRFWIDDYISHLDPVEKLMFLYFLTNPYTDICGIYEIPIKHIALETGIDKEMVEKILKRFEKDCKIFYENGWIAVKNFAKYQLDNPKVKRGIELGMEKAPKSLKNKVQNSVSVDYDSLSHPNPNPNPNPNLKIADRKSAKVIKFNPLGEEIIKEFENVDSKNKTYYGNKTQRAACDFLISEYGFEQVKKVIKILPEIKGLEFMPIITSPYDLKEKWEKLKIALFKLKKSQTINNNPTWKIWT